MTDIRELYDLNEMQVRPRNGDYRLFYLGDLAARIASSRQPNTAVNAEMVQVDYDRLQEEDRAIVDEHLKNL